MPLPVNEIFSPEMLQLLEHVERSLHHIKSQITTREQAIIVKQRILLPIGGINSRFRLQSTSRHAQNVLTERPPKD